MSEDAVVKKQPNKHTRAKPNMKKETNPLTVLFEKMRPKNTPLEQRQKYMQQALEMMGDRIPSLVNSPVQARMIELICKHGTAEQREQVLEQLRPHLRSMLESKYSRFTAVELLHPKKTKGGEELIRELVVPNGAKFMKNAVSNISLNMIFNNCGQNLQQSIVNRIITKNDSESRDFIVSQMKENPMVVAVYLQNVQKPLQLAEGKMLLGSVVCMRVLLELFRALFWLQDNGHAEYRAQLYDFLAFLQNIEADQFKQLIDTTDGAELACYIFAMQPPKQKKTLINSIKPQFRQICREDRDAARFLTVAALQIDDVVLTKAAFLEPAAQNYELFVATKSNLYCFGPLIVSQFVRVISGDGKCSCCLDDGLTGIIKNTEKISACKKPIIKRQFELCELYLQALERQKLFDEEIVQRYATNNKNCYFDLLREILGVELPNDVELERQATEIQRIAAVIKANICKSLLGDIAVLIQNTNAHFNYKKVLKLLADEQKAQLRETMKLYTPSDDKETKRVGLVMEWLE